MSKTKVLAVLVMLVSLPIGMFADFRENLDRLEFGASAGVGFYVGQQNPVASRPDLLRIQSYDAVGFGDRGTLKWPGIETFGFNLGYRFDTRWHLVAQAVRQRVCFAEYDREERGSEVRGLYYNAMWHVDAMAEYNLLRYGNKMQPESGVYNVVPYVGLGIGCTMYNQTATLRAVNSTICAADKDINTWQPMVGKLYKGKDEKGNVVKEKGEIGVGLYIPMAFGVKWRINDNVQLIGSFQYQMYLSGTGNGGLNSNITGGTAAEYYQGHAAMKPEVINNIKNRRAYEMLDKKTIGSHDCMFSISAVFNLERWHEERLVY